MASGLRTQGKSRVLKSMNLDLDEYNAIDYT